MLVFKIAHKKYANNLAGSGADGRWTSAGKTVVYCAESIALAFLENMVKRQGVGFNDDFKTIIINIPDELGVEAVSLKNLPAGWRGFRDYTSCQKIGNKWYDKMKDPILKAPSAVLPESSNYVLNTNHPDFLKVKIVSITDLVPDERIEDILKGSTPKPPKGGFAGG